MFNRVAEGFSPPAPTPPSMRVRTREPFGGLLDLLTFFANRAERQAHRLSSCERSRDELCRL